MILWSLCSSRHVAGGSQFASWAQEMGRSLVPIISHVGAQLPWRQLRAHPWSDMLVLFPLLEGVTGRRSEFHDQAWDAIDTELRSGRGSEVIGLASDLAGFGNRAHLAAPSLDGALAELRVDRSAAAASWLYNVAHTIFYATALGTRSLTLAGDQESALRQVLRRGTATAIAANQLDATAEVSLAMAWSGLRDSPEFLSAADALARVALDEGSVPVHGTRQCDDFEHRYHSTILSLLVLVEVDLVTASRRRLASQSNHG